MSANLHLRRATLGDEDAVVKIIDAYGGWDYMPSHYSNMISDPDFVGVVAEDKETAGDLVAFVGAYVANGGSTMLIKGGRVREDFHGQGVYGRLWTYLKESVESIYPGVKYEEFTVNTHNQVLKQSGKDQKYTELFRRDFWNIKIIEKLQTDYIKQRFDRIGYRIRNFPKDTNVNQNNNKTGQSDDAKQDATTYRVRVTQKPT